MQTQADREGLKTNCADLLFKTNREIKSLNYKLMRVVATDENFHTVLYPGRVNDVEVIEQTPIVCKVPVKGMLSPVKFVITFKTSSGDNPGAKTPKSQQMTALALTKADLKVFLSITHKEPGENRFEKVYTNVSIEFSFNLAKTLYFQFDRKRRKVYTI